MDSGLWIADCRWRIADCGLWIADSGLWIVDSRMGIAENAKSGPVIIWDLSTPENTVDTTSWNIFGFFKLTNQVNCQYFNLVFFFNLLSSVNCDHVRICSHDSNTTRNSSEFPRYVYLLVI